MVLPGLACRLLMCFVAALLFAAGCAPEQGWREGARMPGDGPLAVLEVTAAIGAVDGGDAARLGLQKLTWSVSVANNGRVRADDVFVVPVYHPEIARRMTAERLATSAQSLSPGGAKTWKGEAVFCAGSSGKAEIAGWAPPLPVIHVVWREDGRARHAAFDRTQGHALPSPPPWAAEAEKTVAAYLEALRTGDAPVLEQLVWRYADESAGGVIEPAEPVSAAYLISSWPVSGDRVGFTRAVMETQVLMQYAPGTPQPVRRETYYVTLTREKPGEWRVAEVHRRNHRTLRVDPTPEELAAAQDVVASYFRALAAGQPALAGRLVHPVWGELSARPDTSLREFTLDRVDFTAAEKIGRVLRLGFCVQGRARYAPGGARSDGANTYFVYLMRDATAEGTPWRIVSIGSAP